MMLRNRSRSEQKAKHISHLMFDAIPDSHSHSDVSVLEHKNNNSFFNIPRGLFRGYKRKGSESIGSLTSPTSTLDLRVFSSFANPFKFRRSSNEGSQKTWDCSSKVGLSIIGSLDDELEQMGRTPLRSEESKSIIFGPRMRRIQMQSFQMRFDSFETVCAKAKPPGFEKRGSDVLFVSGDSPLYRDDSFGDIHSCSPPDSGSQLARSNSNSELLSSSSVFEKGMNPELPATEVSSKPASIASISAIEIQRSEYYTCVKTHSPYPKVTHIFGDCILEWHDHELTNSSKNGEIPMGTEGFKKPTAYPPSPSSHFLSFCHHCKKELDGEDIYIYRGEKAFCSSSCRSEEISIDDDEDDSEKTNFGDEFSQNGLFVAI